MSRVDDEPLSRVEKRVYPWWGCSEERFKERFKEKNKERKGRESTFWNSVMAAEYLGE